MGLDKRFLTIQAQPLIVWVVECLRALVDDVSGYAFNGIGARVVTNVYPGQGGLAAAQGEWAVMVAGDMPLLNPALLRAMMRLAQDSEADILAPQ